MKGILNISVCVVLLSVFLNRVVFKSDVKRLCNENDNETTKDCILNPNSIKNMMNIVKKQGLNLEVYRVKTDDGYVLTTLRIPPKTGKGKSVIFLQHPLISTSLFWVDKGNYSYAFALHHAGYDVWLSNTRDTAFSEGHVNFSRKDYEYWNFSWHEVGIYDLGAQLRLVKNVTNDKIIYLGYSLGTTLSFVYASVVPEEAEQHVKLFIGVSPTAYGANVGAPIKHLVKFRVHKILKALLDYFKIGALTESIIIPYSSHYCLKPQFSVFCDMFIKGLCSAGKNPTSPKFYEHAVVSHPATVGIKLLYHYFQLWDGDGLFRYYDHANEKNLEYYNSSTPPEYPLENIKVPFHFIHGTLDPIATPLDTMTLYNRLPNEVRFGKKEFEDYDHCCMFMSDTMLEKTFQHSMEFIGNFLKNQSNDS